MRCAVLSDCLKLNRPKRYSPARCTCVVPVRRGTEANKLKKKKKRCDTKIKEDVVAVLLLKFSVGAKAAQREQSAAVGDTRGGRGPA
ncbi:hypothetical protein EVAR_24542_1 [Eumeta japonica]|uniref:Uncharacterized protein n=1 Tax=Eumeta variegata TaxID=151549 RepID=A0A4C1USA4_EUMVA|nr:hypothetical protein EVAR_24542_1 [Eumeta japonica]